MLRRLGYSAYCRKERAGVMTIKDFQIGDRVKPLGIDSMHGTVRIITRDRGIGVELDHPVIGGNDLHGVLPPGSQTGWWAFPSLWEVTEPALSQEDIGIEAPNLSEIFT